MLQTDANQDGTISADEWAKMKKRMGAREEVGQGEVLEVYKPFRPRRGVVEDGLGRAAAKETDYEWLSTDGYPLVGAPDRVPDYRHAEAVRTVICRLDVAACFPRSLRETPGGAERLLRRVALEQPACGDCLLALLVGQTPAGMEPLLPSRTLRTRLIQQFNLHTSFLSSTRPFSSPHKLAHQTLFFSAPFASPHIHRGRPSFLAHDPRIWALRNIQRYQYVLGT
jgi:hypothetical protein